MLSVTVPVIRRTLLPPHKRSYFAFEILWRHSELLSAAHGGAEFEVRDADSGLWIGALGKEDLVSWWEVESNTLLLRSFLASKGQFKIGFHQRRTKL